MEGSVGTMAWELVATVVVGLGSAMACLLDLKERERSV